MSRQQVSIQSDTLFRVIDRVNYLLTNTVDVSVGPMSAMPSEPLEGSLHISTDDNLIYQFRVDDWVMVGGSETIDWSDVVNKIVASSLEDGLMSKEDFDKLQGISENAKNVTVDSIGWDAATRTLTLHTTVDGVEADVVVALTHSHPATEVVEDTTHRFVPMLKKPLGMLRRHPQVLRLKQMQFRTT